MEDTLNSDHVRDVYQHCSKWRIQTANKDEIAAREAFVDRHNITRCHFEQRRDILHLCQKYARLRVWDYNSYKTATGSHIVVIAVELDAAGKPTIDVPVCFTLAEQTLWVKDGPLATYMTVVEPPTRAIPLDVVEAVVYVNHMSSSDDDRAEMTRQLQLDADGDVGFIHNPITISEGPTLLVKMAGDVVGLVTFNRNRREIAIITVFGGYRKRGIGRTIIADFEALAAKNKFTPTANDIVSDSHGFWDAVEWDMTSMYPHSEAWGPAMTHSLALRPGGMLDVMAAPPPPY
jgi:hypothetical protein